MSDHVVAVVATVDEAEQRFSTWLARRGLHYEELKPDDVRVDAHEGHDGVTRMRFWVRAELAGGPPGQPPAQTP
ncbi:MAG: hypothetical protein ABR541_01625 [Candidatus Dormibacteria bacterium]